MEALHSLEDTLWFSRTWSALRTGVACLLVLLLSSKCLPFMEFSVFAYVTAITLVGESSLGKCLADTSSLFKGTLQSTVLSLIVLSVLGSQNFTLPVCLVCVFFTSFAFSYYPASRPAQPVRKRVALALSCIVYVSFYINPHKLHPIFFPLKLATTTLLGTVCSIVALVFPLPHLAAYQVRCKAQLAAQLVLENFLLLLDTLNEPEHALKLSACLKSKSKTAAVSKIIAYLTKKHEEAEWEPKFVRLPGGLSKEFAKRISILNSSLTNMNMALEKLRIPEQKDPQELQGVRDWSKLALAELVVVLKSNKPANPGIVDKGMDALLSLNDAVLGSHLDERSFGKMFFLFNVKQFVQAEIKFLKAVAEQPAKLPEVHTCEKRAAVCTGSSESQPPKGHAGWTMKLRKLFHQEVDKKSLIESFKTSLSLVIAVALGVWYKKDYGYWSTITVALGLYNTSSGTFRTTSLRIHGTALGTVYGYLVALITHQAVLTTLAAMLPWLLLTSFLRESKMLGLSGASSTFTSAVIILGKRRHGPVQDFTIIRVTQAVLGLSAFLIVEALIRPRRAAVFAGDAVGHNLKMLQSCLDETVAISTGQAQACRKCFDKRLSELEQKVEKLEAGISHLKALIREAQVEPDFWHSPFRADSFGKLADVQSRMVGLLHLLLLCTNVPCLDKELQITSELRCLYEFWQHKQQDQVSDIESQESSPKRSSSIDLSAAEDSPKTFQLLHGAETAEAKLSLAAFAVCSQELFREMVELEKTIVKHLQETAKT